MTRPAGGKSAKKRKKVVKRTGVKAIALISKSSKSVKAGDLLTVQLMWNLYIDWCLWKPVGWYVSFGEYMRLLLTEKDNPGFSKNGAREIKEKARVARMVFPRLLRHYGITPEEEITLYKTSRPLWKKDLASGSADPAEGLDGWLGQMSAKKDRKSLFGREKRLYDVVRAHLKGVRDGILGTSARHVAHPTMPGWLAEAAGENCEVPESDLVNAVERMAKEVRNRPPTADEKRHARRSIHNWSL